MNTPADRDLSAIRLVFFGTPEFAVPALQALHQAGFQITTVVTQPDRPAGRRQVLTPPPVKLAAIALNLPVEQPDKIRTSEFHQWLKDQRPDLAVVVAYGKIFPGSLLSIPRLGFVNVHASLLPELRGSSPIPFAILNRFQRTGVTIMLMDESVDTGPILSQQAMDLPPRATALWLHDQLRDLGARLLVDTLPKFISGRISPTPQPSVGTVTKRLMREDGEVKWSEGPELLDLKVRAFHPFPGVTVTDPPGRLKLIATELDHNQLVLKRVQPEGRTVMTGADFKRGYPDWVLPSFVRI